MNEVILSAKHVRKSFGLNVIHRDINFNLFKGETLGLLGNSGTGKSVLLRSIVGLEYIDSGEIYFHNKRIDQLKEDEWRDIRKKISYAFQNGALFDSSNVFENIAYPLFEHTKLEIDQINKKVAEVLSIIDLNNKENLMPADLSGGMQKRVGLARAIILDPEIILYDEPTAGLDPVNVENIIKIVNRLKQRGISSIFVTHDIPVALELCDRIMIIDEGEVAYTGTPSEFTQAQDPIVKRFLKTHKEQHVRNL